MSSIEISTSELGKADEVLKQLGGGWLGNQALRRAMTATGKIVIREAKARAPKPGYDGDKPGLKPLRDTIGQAFREYTAARVIVIGPMAPAGAHGHLVEHGHRMVVAGTVARDWQVANAEAEAAGTLSARQRRAIAGWKRRRRSTKVNTGRVVGFVQGKPFMEPAAKTTESQQRATFDAAMRDELAKLVTANGGTTT